MTLEDHVGDVIRKARQAAGITSEHAARTAEISPDVLAQLERSGSCAGQVNFLDLGRLLGLHGRKLQELAKGWLPSLVQLDTWRELRQITTAGSDMTVNCYLVWDEVTREAALFDTGFDAKPILQILDEHNLQLRHLFITHTHEDHIAALGPVRERFPKVKLHSSSKTAPPEQRNRSNDFIHLGSLRITNRETPGHSEDGVTYIVGNFPEDAPNAAIVGDCIFAGSMGRGNQSTALLKQKVETEILSLPGPTLLCPGHGPLTTVEEEKSHNPFFAY